MLWRIYVSEAEPLVFAMLGVNVKTETKGVEIDRERYD